MQAPLFQKYIVGEIYKLRKIFVFANLQEAGLACAGLTEGDQWGVMRGDREVKRARLINNR